MKVQTLWVAHEQANQLTVSVYFVLCQNKQHYSKWTVPLGLQRIHMKCLSFCGGRRRCFVSAAQSTQGGLRCAFLFYVTGYTFYVTLGKTDRCMTVAENTCTEKPGGGGRAAPLCCLSEYNVLIITAITPLKPNMQLNEHWVKCWFVPVQVLRQFPTWHEHSITGSAG